MQNPTVENCRFVQQHEQCNPNTAGTRTSKKWPYAIRAFPELRLLHLHRCWHFPGLGILHTCSSPLSCLHRLAIQHSRRAAGPSHFCLTARRDGHHWCEIKYCWYIGKSNTFFSQSLHLGKASFPITMNPVHQRGLYFFNSVVLIMTVHLWRGLQLGCLHVERPRSHHLYT